jgi:DNA-binding transcriptional LysR family regulator
MALPELLRTFVAVYRAGSVTDAAWVRGMSQPAASQQLQALERQVGASLFLRGPLGVTPTQRGRELYAEVTEALDALEVVMGRLTDDAQTGRLRPVRLGASPEYFAGVVLARLGGCDVPLSAVFAAEAELLSELSRGEIDIAITRSEPSSRRLSSIRVGETGYHLVASPTVGPEKPLPTIGELGVWIEGKPWVAYSHELPKTRRFWRSVVGQPFPMPPTLVAPDLSVVLRAVELGFGLSLLPSYLCQAPLARGELIDVFPVGDLIEPDAWFACSRAGGSRSRAMTSVLSALARTESAGLVSTG